MKLLSEKFKVKVPQGRKPGSRRFACGSVAARGNGETRMCGAAPRNEIRVRRASREGLQWKWPQAIAAESPTARPSLLKNRSGIYSAGTPK